MNIRTINRKNIFILISYMFFLTACSSANELIKSPYDVGDFGSNWSTSAHAGHDDLSGIYAATMTIYNQRYLADSTLEFNPQSISNDIILYDKSTPNQIANVLRKWGLKVAVIKVKADTVLHENDILYTVDPFDRTKYIYLTINSINSGWSFGVWGYFSQYYHPKNGKVWISKLSDWVGSQAIILLDRKSQTPSGVRYKK
jgi:hypothetical protein